MDEKLFRTVRISEDRPAAADAVGYLARETIARSQSALASLWEAERADRAVRQAVEALFNDEPPDWFVAAITRRLDGLTRGQVKSALERMQVHLDTPPPAEGTDIEDLEAQDSPVECSTPPSGGRAGQAAGSLRDLIQAGIVRPPLTVTKRYLGRDLQAEIREDGSVVFNGEAYRTLSTAAAKAREWVKGGPPAGRASWATNGWAFWLYRDVSGTLQPMDVLRKTYRRPGSDESA